MKRTLRAGGLSYILDVEATTKLFSGSRLSCLPSRRVVCSGLNDVALISQPSSLIQPQSVTGIPNLLLGDFHLLASNLALSFGRAGCCNSSVGSLFSSVGTATSFPNAFINGFQGAKGGPGASDNREHGKHFDYQPRLVKSGVRWIVGAGLVFYNMYRLRLRFDLRGIPIVGGVHLLAAPTLKNTALLLVVLHS